MKITIFGASGAIGQLLVQRALDDGDFVTAYVRNPRKISLNHPRLSLIQGELSDVSSIEKAIADAHELIIGAMKKHNSKRLITLATPALQSDDDKKNRSTILPGVLAKVFLPNGYAEQHSCTLPLVIANGSAKCRLFITGKS